MVRSRKRSNPELKRATWLNLKNTNPHYGFVEYVYFYFDDLGLSHRGDYPRLVDAGFLSSAEVEAVSDFHAALDAYDAPNGDDHDHAAILRDPRWNDVVIAAQAARERLLAVLTDPSETEVLLKPSPYAAFAAQS